MALYLVQHGESLSAEQDPGKGLSAHGRQQVTRIAQVAAGYNVPVAKICHSHKRRAVETAQVFNAILTPEGGAHAIDGIDPMDDVVRFSDTLNLTENLMIVGHLPFLERLIAYRVTGCADEPIMRVQNGGIVCLEYDGEAQHAVLKWALMPNIP